MEMNFDETSLVATMNPFILIGALTCVILIAYFSAKRYSNTFDFKKSSKMYLIACVPYAIIMVFLKIPIIMVLGFVITGFIVMMGISNHFFYK